MTPPHWIYDTGYEALTLIPEALIHFPSNQKKYQLNLVVMGSFQIHQVRKFISCEGFPVPMISDNLFFLDIY